MYPRASILSRVAVVGAGMAGLVCGHKLAEAGHAVRVFEKARGPGGRMSTRRHDAYAFDHGAQYFTCRAPEFVKQVQDWCDRGIAAEWRAPVHLLRAGELSRGKGETRRYVGTPRMSSIARELSRDLEMSVGERVTALRSTDPGVRPWSLQSESGARYDGFDAVVIAVPARQAVPLLEPAPKFANRARAVSMLPCHATMAVFASELHTEFGGAFVEGSPLSWIARNASKPGRPATECWVLHSTAAWSSTQLDADADLVGEAMIEALAEALGFPLPETVFRASHRWLLARSAEPLEDAVLWDPSTKVGVCGDWLHGDRVEGAFLSGSAMAKTLCQGLGG